MITAEILEISGSPKSFNVVFSKQSQYLGRTSVISRAAGNDIIALILPLLRNFEA